MNIDSDFLNDYFLVTRNAPFKISGSGFGGCYFDFDIFGILTDLEIENIKNYIKGKLKRHPKIVIEKHFNDKYGLNVWFYVYNNDCLLNQNSHE